MTGVLINVGGVQRGGRVEVLFLLNNCLAASEFHYLLRQARPLASVCRHGLTDWSGPPHSAQRRRRESASSVRPIEIFGSVAMISVSAGIGVLITYQSTQRLNRQGMVAIISFCRTSRRSIRISEYYYLCDTDWVRHRQPGTAKQRSSLAGHVESIFLT
jgi:hypothetical protein